MSPWSDYAAQIHRRQACAAIRLPFDPFDPVLQDGQAIVLRQLAPKKLACLLQSTSWVLSDIGVYVCLYVCVCVWFADLTDKAATLSSSALGVTGGVAAAGLAVFAARTLLGRAETQTASSGNGNGVSSNGNGSNGNGRSAASSSEARREQETVSTGVSAGGQRE